VTPQAASGSVRLTSVRKARTGYSRGGITGALFRRPLWIAPVLAMVCLAIAGYWLRSRIDAAMKEQKQSELVTLLRADVEALKLWIGAEKDYIDAASEAPVLRKSVLDLVRFAQERSSSVEALLGAEPRQALVKALEPWLDEFQSSSTVARAGEHKYIGYVVLDNKYTIVASDTASLIGLKSSPGYREFAEQVLAGKTVVTQPFPSRSAQPDENGELVVGAPTMFAAAPVKDDAGRPVAVLGIRLRPSQDFTKILNVARTGASGETYAFNKDGKLLSNSRFDEDLKELGLLSTQAGSRSALTLDLRDPGVDMMTGARPALPRSKQPLTRMAADAIHQKPGIDAPGVDVEGYRDYRGVPVLGAWAWLPELGFAVATEIDADEAFRPVVVLRNAFWTLFGLLSALALLLLVMTFVARRMETKMREAVIAAGQLGQYALEEKIGEGGMGSVYRGRHSMLRRPTAIKLLEPSKTTEISIARFEREVQHTSQLNHPNTITIYDYGRTSEGVFYYAMEYLAGLSLQSLVERFGAQPDGRVIHIMLQVCGSLSEAHAQHLIHRDIKPANIMLTARGGVRDFVKLLDFGLVKAVDSEKQRTLTAADVITGTPLYLPPESIQDTDRADERSDLYSLGGVAYFLLTGHPMFEAGGVMEIIRKQVEDLPVSPSKRVGHAICADLEKLVLQCLAKNPQDRPQSAAAVAEALRKCVPLVSWSARDADNWWSSFDSGLALSALAPTQTVAFAGTMGENEVKPAG
jgi:hypothetical protein